MSARLPAAALSALQMAVAATALLVVLIVSGEVSTFSEVSKLTLLSVAASGVVGFALADPAYVRALALVGMQRTYPVTISLFILLTAGAGVVILDERFTPGLLLGGALIAAGTYPIVVRPQAHSHGGIAGLSPSSPALPGQGAGPASGVVAVSARPSRVAEGYALLVLVPVLWTVATVWLASARGELSAVAASGLRLPVGTFVLLGFMLAARPRDLRAPLADPRDGITIAAAGLVGLAAGSLLYVYALLEVGAARSAVLSATSPLFAIPLAILVLGEQLTVRVLIGTLVTVGGIVVVVTL